MYYIAGEQISGKALCQLDRETLKEIGIKSIGKQFELLTNVKTLIGNWKFYWFNLYYAYPWCVHEVACDNILKFLAQHCRAFSVELFKGNTFFVCNDNLLKQNEPIYVCLFHNQFWLNWQALNLFFPQILIDKKQNQQVHKVKESSKWKRKIKKEDQSTWTESNKNLYRVK